MSNVGWRTLSKFDVHIFGGLFHKVSRYVLPKRSKGGEFTGDWMAHFK